MRNCRTSCARRAASTTAAWSSRRRTSTLPPNAGNGAAPHLFGARIASVGHYVPAGVLTNADFERMFDTSDEWIVTRTGMRERRIAAADMAVSDLAFNAAEHALERAHLKATEIDCYIVATVTPDYLFPATACLVASRLGAVGKPAFDIEIACSGFIYGLTVAASLVRSGVYRRVMLIGAEKLSGITDYTDRSTAILFGDGAGAVIVERAERDSFLGCELGSDGSNPEVLYQPAGGSREPLTEQGVRDGRHFIHMQGREVFKQAVTKMMESAKSALGQAHLTPADVTYMVPHQANFRIIDAAARQLSMPSDRVLINVDRFGNTSSASIPIVLSENVEKGVFKPDDILLFTGFGGGLSWGSVAWRWS